MSDLREALAARPDGDFVTSAPQRRAAPVRRGAPARRAAPAKGKKKPGVGARLLSLVFQHPREVLVTVLLTGCAGAIAWNALALQTARHPAPLFNHAAEHPAAVAAQPSAQPSMLLPPSRPAAAEPQQAETTLPSHASPAAAPVSMGAPKPPSRSAIADLINNKGEITQPQRVSAAAPATAPVVAAAPAKAPVARDPIADIIRMGGPVPVPPGNVGKAEAGDPVLSGQRALAKLGYGVKPDGLMGAETRQAIERFEHDRRLPVTGEFTPRTMRELAALSGIAVP
ncbi:peptidoglycan-binding domain-containing protein [Microvirga sp. 2TAF3]|uniref:peptidoglycan-binding domain-containing protein n=1 Tax=Microvirga sp. 2TAF3 TaxID=3233014 RepID=UPI003F9DB007